MSPFEQLVNEFLDHEFQDMPVMASQLGLSDYDDRLDDLSATAMQRRTTDAQAWHDLFAAVADADLTASEQIDRDLAIAMLRGRTIVADWEGWKRDPVTYSGLCLSGIFTLWLHRLRPEEALVESTLRRLAAIPGVLEQGTANLDPSLAHPLIVERGIASAKGGARYLRDLLPLEVSDHGARRQVAGAGATAADAFDAWAAHLQTVSALATGSWVFGEERYSRLLREKENLTFDARSLRDMGQQEYDRLDAEMSALALQIRGTSDWKQVLEEANDDHPRTEETMRDAYEVWTARARDFLAETGLVTLPDGERCSVEPSPVFQRPLIGVASYIGPPAFSDSTAGHFFVPFAPDGASDEEKQERLKSNSNGGIPTTAVHEAYPGHHWHIVMRRLYANRIRRVYGTPYFTEGWALYAERLMRERGFFNEPIHELYHLEATIFRAARIIVDTSLHLGEMSYDDAVTFMVEKANLPEVTAQAEVGRYCWWPTQASAYLTGCLEILRIRDRFMAARGATPADADALRDFHDALTSSGTMPIALAERAVMARA